jgi:alpha-1,2-mannosyltransferase
MLLAGSAATFAVNASIAMPDMTDLREYRVAAALLMSGQSPYGPLPAATGDELLTGGHHTPYPPTFFALLGPILVLPVIPARLAWLALELTCLALTVTLVHRGIGGPTRTERLVVLAAVLLFEPVRSTIYYGQTGILLAFLLVLAFHAHLRGRPRLGGVALGLAMAVKLTPLAVLAYLAWRRDWRLVAWSAATVVGVLALTLLLGWYTRWPEYLAFMPPIGRGTPLVDNQSVNGVVLRVLNPANSGQPIGPLPLPVLLTWYALEGTLAIAVAATLRRYRASLGIEAWYSFALLLVALPLLEPFAWDHHWAVAVPAIVVAGQMIRTGVLARGPAVVLVVAYLLFSLVGYPLVHYGKEIGVLALHGYPLLLAATSLMFTCGLAACIAMLSLRAPWARLD